MKMKHNNKGFSLVELIVVIAIMAILGGVGTAGYTKYIEHTRKNTDKKLVGDVVRALETSAYSKFADFTVPGQYTQGIQIPVGFVVMSDKQLTANGKTGYILALSNDEEKDPIGISLAASLGDEYSSTTKLMYDKWNVDTITTSTFHNASAGIFNKIDKVGSLMIALQDVIQLTSTDYDDTGDMMLTVSARIADYNNNGTIEASDKTTFVEMWANASNQSADSYGFGFTERENYSAIRMAYSSAFGEYVRANYSGTQDADTLANNISNYGQSAGDLAYEKASEKAGGGFLGGLAGAAAEKIVDKVAPNTNFPYAATSKAFDDRNYAGYGDEKCKELYNKWIEGADEADAAMFYDTMVTMAVDGKAYAEDNGTDEFVEWFSAQATAFSENFNKVDTIVNGKSAIVVAVYYHDGILKCDVFSNEADPRNK